MERPGLYIMVFIILITVTRGCSTWYAIDDLNDKLDRIIEILEIEK